MRLDLPGAALGDLLAEVQHRDALGQAHHQIHGVLDQEDRQPPRLQGADVLGETLLLGPAHARGRLVEQEQAGLSGQGPRHLQAALLAEVELLHQIVAPRGQPGQLQQVHDPPALSAAVAVARGPHRHPHVVEHAHAREESDVLEGPADPQTHDVVGAGAADLVALEGDGAGGGREASRHHVEHRGLARAVRPDEREDAPARDLEGHLVERAQPAEVARDAVHAEDRRAHATSEPRRPRNQPATRCARASSISPRGRKIIITMIRPP
jgi:hypothetical protein